MAGYDVSLAEAGELRTDVATDEITPLQVMLNYDEKLAQFAHTGLVINGERPVAENALVDANIAVIVAGRRYGKGSSREHSPFAELSAGICLVIAESFERIYVLRLSKKVFVSLMSNRKFRLPWPLLFNEL